MQANSVQFGRFVWAAPIQKANSTSALRARDGTIHSTSNKESPESTARANHDFFSLEKEMT